MIANTATNKNRSVVFCEMVPKNLRVFTTIPASSYSTRSGDVFQSRVCPDSVKIVSNENPDPLVPRKNFLRHMSDQSDNDKKQKKYE